MKKVTVIIPVYNMEHFVAEGVRCVTEQTYTNLEIIMIDDGSRDRSYLKCLAEADKDRRISVFSKNNEGPAAARNLALRKATGDYIYFFDIDDYLEKNAIEVLVGAIEKNECDLAVCGFSMYDGKKITQIIKKRAGVFDAEEARRNYAEYLSMYEEKGIQGAPWYKLYRLSIIRENQIQFPNLRKSEDDVFIARYVDCIKRFCIVPDILCRYTVNTYKRFWEKYPFDIFDTARQSTILINEIVMGWNVSNTETRDKIYCDYFKKVFASFCFLFNPKLKLNRKQRLARMREIGEQFLSDIPNDFYISHKVFEKLKDHNYKAVYMRIVLHLIRHYFV